jgi:hypothetical protein
LPSVSPKGVQTFPFVQMFFTMTVKKKRELVLGPLLTSRGSFALPHQKTFDRCHFPFFFKEGESLSPAPEALQMHETKKEGCPPSPIPHTKNVKGKKKARNIDAN